MEFKKLTIQGELPYKLNELSFSGISVRRVGNSTQVIYDPEINRITTGLPGLREKVDELIAASAKEDLHEPTRAAYPWAAASRSVTGPGSIHPLDALHIILGDAKVITVEKIVEEKSPFGVNIEAAWRMGATKDSEWECPHFQGPTPDIDNRKRFIDDIVRSYVSGKINPLARLMVDSQGTEGYRLHPGVAVFTSEPQGDVFAKATEVFSLRYDVAAKENVNGLYLVSLAFGNDTLSSNERTATFEYSNEGGFIVSAIGNTTSGQYRFVHPRGDAPIPTIPKGIMFEVDENGKPHAFYVGTNVVKIADIASAVIGQYVANLPDQVNYGGGFRVTRQDPSSDFVMAGSFQVDRNGVRKFEKDSDALVKALDSYQRELKRANRVHS